MMSTKMRVAGLVGAALLALWPTGCAKAPGGGTPGNSTGTQIIVTMTVAGNINPSYHYYVLFNNANDVNGSNGPVPVVTTQDTSSNGFATGRVPGGGFTQFVSYDSTGVNFQAVVPGSNLRSFQALGRPLTSSVTGNTLQFSIRLSDLATTAVPASQINSLQINFVTTNITPVDPNYSGTTKYFDALGDPFQAGNVNNYVTISAQQPRVFINTTGETSGDVAYFVNGSFQRASIGDPNNPVTQQAADLDITSWSVEVRG